MSAGKPAGVRCVQLDENNLCLLFGSDARPKVCLGLVPSLEMCGESDEEAFSYLGRLEELTKPE